MDFATAKILLAALEFERVRYVLVGSMAMAVQGIIRATHDIDLFLAPDAENVAALRRALQRAFGNDPNIEQITSEDLTGDYPAIEYVPPNGEYSLDILSRLGDAFCYADIESEEIAIEGIRVRVATPKMLYRMKHRTVRPQDRIDADALQAKFHLPEED